VILMVTIRYYATLMATPPEDHYGMTNLREQCPTTCTAMEYHAHTNQNTYFQTLVKDQTSLLTGPTTQLPSIPEPVLLAKTPLKLLAKRGTQPTKAPLKNTGTGIQYPSPTPSRSFPFPSKMVVQCILNLRPPSNT
jgi:hypothetical protein